MSDKEDISYAETHPSHSFNSTGGVMAINEKLSGKNIALECELSHLKREYSSLKSFLTKDQNERDVISNMANKLVETNSSIEYWQDKYNTTQKEFIALQATTSHELEEYDKKNSNLVKENRELEKENEKLKEQIENDKSLIFLLEGEKNLNLEFFGNEEATVSRSTYGLELDHIKLKQKIEEIQKEFEIQKMQLKSELKASREEVEKLQSNLGNATKALRAFLSSKNLKDSESLQGFMTGIVGQLNCSSPEMNYSDAEQIAANMYMILEKLDKNQRNTADLQNEIIEFLAAKGLGTDIEAVSTFTGVFQNIIEKRRQTIKNENEKLAQEYKGNAGFDACLQQLDEDSMNTSHSMPDSFYRNLDSSIHKPSFRKASVLETSNVDETRAQPNAVSFDEFTAKTMGRAGNLAEACARMFEKLRGTAEFFQKLLPQLGMEGVDLLTKIEELKIDLDKSLGEALSIRDEARNAEKSLRNMMEKSGNASFHSSSIMNESQDQGADLLSDVLKTCKFCDSLKQTLNNELISKDLLLKKIANLETEKADMIPNKENIAREIHGELTKICDTLSSVSSTMQKHNIVKKFGK